MVNKRVIYLDNSATTRVDDEVAEVVKNMMLNNYGNPSSLHFMGTDALNSLYKARCQVAQVIGARTDNIFFTSGGTESNNLAIIGGAKAMADKGKTIVTTSIEHSSVQNSVKYLEDNGYTVKYINPDPESHRIRAEDVIGAVDEDTTVLSIMHINNETGEILPLKEIVSGVRAKNPDTLIHVDCVQSFAKYPFRLYETDVDMVSASSHKLYGPKGVGALYIKNISMISSMMFGGKQEKGIRPGTENTPGIIGFGLASTKSLIDLNDNLRKNRKLKDMLIQNLKQYDFVHINSPEDSFENILNFSVCGQKSEDILEYFAKYNIYFSAGSAFEKGAKSHVLQAMGYDGEILDGALRISLGKYNTIEDIHIFNEIFNQYLKDIQS